MHLTLAHSPKHVCLINGGFVELIQQFPCSRRNVDETGVIAAAFSPCGEVLVLLRPDEVLFLSVGTLEVFASRKLPQTAISVCTSEDAIFLLLEATPKIAAVGLLDWTLLQTSPEAAMTAVVFSSLDLSNLLASANFGTSESRLYSASSASCLALLPHGVVRVELDSRGKAYLVWSTTLPPHFRPLGATSDDRLLVSHIATSEISAISLKSGRREEISVSSCQFLTVSGRHLFARRTHVGDNTSSVVVFDLFSVSDPPVALSHFSPSAVFFPDGWVLDSGRVIHVSHPLAQGEVLCENLPPNPTTPTKLARHPTDPLQTAQISWRTPRQLVHSFASALPRPVVQPLVASSPGRASATVVVRATTAADRLASLKAEMMPLERQVEEWLAISEEVSDPKFVAELSHKYIKFLAQLYQEFPISLDAATIARFCRWLVCRDERNAILLARLTGVADPRELRLEAALWTPSCLVNEVMDETPNSVLTCEDAEIEKHLPPLDDMHLSDEASGEFDAALVRWKLRRLEEAGRLEEALEEVWQDERRAEIFRLAEIAETSSSTVAGARGVGSGRGGRSWRGRFAAISLGAEDWRSATNGDATAVLPKFIRHAGFRRGAMQEFCRDFQVSRMQGELTWLQLVLEEAEDLSEAEICMREFQDEREVLDSVVKQRVLPTLLARRPVDEHLLRRIQTVQQMASGGDAEGERVERVVTVLQQANVGETLRAALQKLATGTLEEVVEFLASEVLSDQTQYGICVKLLEAAAGDNSERLLKERLLEACPVHFELDLLKKLLENASRAQFDRLFRASYGPKKLQLAHLLIDSSSEAQELIFKSLLPANSSEFRSSAPGAIVRELLSSSTRREDLFSKVGNLILVCGEDPKQILKDTVLQQLLSSSSSPSAGGSSVFHPGVPKVCEESMRRLRDLCESRLWIWLCRRLLMICGDERVSVEVRLMGFSLVFENFNRSEIQEVSGHRLEDVHGLFETLMYLYGVEKTVGLTFSASEFLSVDKFRLASEILAIGSTKRNLDALQVAAALILDFHLTQITPQIVDALKLLVVPSATALVAGMRAALGDLAPRTPRKLACPCCV